jgi:thiol-disulfide isomerase/thioredoxin
MVNNLIMKTALLFFTALVAFMLSAARAQTQSLTQRAHKIDSGTIVMDSAGVKLSYAVWHSLLVSGNYLLKTTNPESDSAGFTLVRQDEATKARLRSLQPKSDERSFIQTGKKIAVFSAKDISGYKIRPKDLAGKVVVLNFWFINCPPCREEIPELNKIALSYASDPNVVFIAVALDEEDDIKTFLKDNPFVYHIVADGREIAAQYEIKSYPASIILDKQGIVKFHTVGYGPYTLEGFTKTIDAVK